VLAPYFAFIGRRLVQMVPLLLGITLIAFAVMQLAPGDYLTQMRANPDVSPQTVEALSRAYGLDKPWPVQYLLWLKNAVTGNFGYSFTYKEPVYNLIGRYVFATVILTFSAMLFSWALAVPMGIYAATHKNGMVDRATALLAYSGISAPGFFVALLALLFAQQSGLFPVGGMTSVNHAQLGPVGRALDIAHHLVLPVLVLGTRGVAGLMRQMRGNLLDVLGENYVLAARARGLHERKVIFKHAVRNAINPLITIFGLEISGLLAGAALVEAVMAWPGLGSLLLDAVRSQDLYVAMASFLMGAVLLMVGNLISDILLAVTDPRIRVA